MDTCFNYSSSDCMYASSDERRLINLIRRLAAKFPDTVHILRQPEENDGCIYAIMPASFLKIKPPATRAMSEGAKQQAAERLRQYREEKHCS